MGIGARLKEARETQGISLESLQDTSKIQKRYLVAIEEENFHILPGKFYARAFIKEYATAVGLDPNELLEEYKEAIPSPEEETSTQYTRIQRSRKDNSPAKSSAVFSIIPTIIVVLLVIGIIFAAWYFITQKTSTTDGNNPVVDQNDNAFIRDPENKQGDTGSSEGDQEDDATDEEEPTANPDKPELVLVEEGTGSKPESTFDLNNAGDEVILKLESSGNTWLEIENGEGKSFYFDAFTKEKSPVELDMSGEDRIYFKSIGHAPDLTITINGVELEYPVDPKEKVVQKIWININKATE